MPFPRHIRRVCADYGTALALIASSSMTNWGYFHAACLLTFPVEAALQPVHGRSWLVHFLGLDRKRVALALLFGFTF